MKINKKMVLTKSEKNKLRRLHDENKDLQFPLLEMYKIISNALDVVGISYVVFGGTSLGASLYNDFIPWDDDFDMAIKFGDKEKLYSKIEKNLPAYLKLISAENTKGYQYAFPKIIDIRYPFSKKEFGENKVASFRFIDITLFKETKKRNKTFISRFFGKILWLRNAQINPFLNILMCIFKIFPQKYLINSINKSFDKSSGTGYMMETNPYSRKYNNKMFSFEKISYETFCDTEVPIISNWENVFSHHYGCNIEDLYKIPKKLITHGIEIEKP